MVVRPRTEAGAALVAKARLEDARVPRPSVEARGGSGGGRGLSGRPVVGARVLKIISTAAQNPVPVRSATSSPARSRPTEPAAAPVVPDRAPRLPPRRPWR